MLLKHRHYFGVEPLKLRAAAARIVARIAGLPPERARVTARQLHHDFGVDTTEGRPARRGARRRRPARAEHRASGRLRGRAALRRDCGGTRHRSAAARARASAHRRRLHAGGPDQCVVGAHPARDRRHRHIRELHEPRRAARASFPSASSCARDPRRGVRTGGWPRRPMAPAQSARRSAGSTRSCARGSSPTFKRCHGRSRSCSAPTERGENLPSGEETARRRAAVT